MLQDKDQEQFTKQLLYYLAGFAVGIPVSTYLHFLGIDELVAALSIRLYALHKKPS